jgi:hypothetical protein
MGDKTETLISGFAAIGSTSSKNTVDELNGFVGKYGRSG